MLCLHSHQTHPHICRKTCRSAMAKCAVRDCAQCFRLKIQDWRIKWQMTVRRQLSWPFPDWRSSLARVRSCGWDRRDVVPISVISTGSISFDAALGVGGVPRGRVIEIFGPESSGKTTITLQIIAEAQKAGGLAAFVDAEHALDPHYAKKLGVDIDNLLVSNRTTASRRWRSSRRWYARALSMCWWSTRSRRWFPRRSLMARWAIRTWACRLG